MNIYTWKKLDEWNIRCLQLSSQYNENWTKCDSVLAFWVTNPAWHVHIVILHNIGVLENVNLKELMNIVDWQFMNPLTKATTFCDLKDVAKLLPLNSLGFSFVGVECPLLFFLISVHMPDYNNCFIRGYVLMGTK